MPGLLQYQTDIHGKDGVPLISAEQPEDVDLELPSQVPKESRQHVSVQSLPAIEEKLRTAQCHDALDSLRHTLKIKSRLIKFKHKNIRGQREGLRSRAIIERVHERARATAAKYRAARAAKLKLSGPGEWENELRVLADADIRSYQDPNKLCRKRGRPGTLEDEHASTHVEEEEMETEDFSLLPEKHDRRDGTGETRRTFSWIWLTAVNPGSDGDEILQIEWAKSRARANRAKEEVLLLKEEMRRVIEFLKWKSQWWLSKAEDRSAGDDLAEGLFAYAHKQARLHNGLSQHFRTIWQAPLQDVNLPQDQSTDEIGEEGGTGDDEDEDGGVVDHGDDDTYL
jgi:hypothetical protein